MMKAVLIDNNDSFTYNIVELIRAIPGSRLDVIPYEKLKMDKLRSYENIILSPGPGLPDDFPVLQDVLNNYHSTKSILGICLGHEAIAKFFGAELSHLPAVVHGQPKAINVVKESLLFTNMPAKFNAGLYHSWVIEKSKFPDELEITGLSDEGNIMSFQHKTLKLFGVQFHPESIITEYGNDMMENFLRTGAAV
jgi:anthranilate synthase/aminodeoxychorismate synthase-like glutamine amidotransferase